MAERLTPLSAAFLHSEDEDAATTMAIASVAVFEGPPPRFEDFRAAIAGRLPLVPRYRQRLRTIPFDLGPPVWVDDPAFDLGWHTRNTALPAPGGRAELARLVARVMAQRMDRERPLWEYWFCEGLEGNRWALISKLHHALVDGVSGTDLYRVILDATPQPQPQVPDEWRPQPMPSTMALTVRSVRDLALSPVTGARDAAGLLRSPLELVRRVGRTGRGILALSEALRPASPTSLTGRLGRQRRYTWAAVRLADVTTVRRSLGGTVNDVALAAISGGFRRLLEARGEEPTPRALRSLVPVSVRAPGQETIRDNRVAMLLPYLPVDVEDPVQRLGAVRDRVSALRAAHEAEASEELTTISQHSPFLPVAIGIRLAFHLPQRQLVTVTTNVPGPRVPLYALGRRLEQVLPYVPIADRVRIGVAIFSYVGELTFGITGDYDTAPDLDVLAEGITASVAELVAAATGD